VTRNELASPYVLGVSSGAGLTVLLTLVVFLSVTVAIPLLFGTFTFNTSSLLPLLAALGGTIAFLLVYGIAWKGGTSPVRLVLAGVIVNMVFQSLQRGLFFFADDLGVVQSALAWITGSLTGTGWEQVRLAIIPATIAILLAIAGARQLNVLPCWANGRPSRSGCASSASDSCSRASRFWPPAPPSPSRASSASSGLSSPRRPDRPRK